MSFLAVQSTVCQGQQGRWRDPRRGPGDRRPHFGVSFRPARPQVALLHHRDAQQRSATSFRRSCAMSKGAAGGGSRRAAAARGTAVQPCTGSRGVGHSPTPTEGECGVVVGQSPRPPLSCTAGAALRCGGGAAAAGPGGACRCGAARAAWAACALLHSPKPTEGECSVVAGQSAPARTALHRRQRCDTAGGRRRRRDQGVPAMRRCQLCLGCSCNAPLTHTQ